MLLNLNQSAAKAHIVQSSEIISKESTLDNNGSDHSLTCNDEGNDIIQTTYKDNFIKKASIKYNSKYDYSKVEYINAKTPVIIICPKHGEFLQTPDKHLSGKYGCPKCSLELKDKSAIKLNQKLSAIANAMTKEQFLEKAKEKYNNKYTYIINNWSGLCSTKIKVICPIHGEFEILARNHLMKNNHTGCPKCGKVQSIQNKTHKYDEVILQLNEQYNNKYLYPETNRINYVNKKSKLEIVCPKHGVFYLSAQKHLSGRECPICTIENLVNQHKLPGGYCEQLFNTNPSLKTIPAILYYLKINNGQYYKIGITTTSINDRIKALTSKAKRFNTKLQFEIINYKQSILYEMFNNEQKILKDFDQFRIYRRWSTELFNTDIYDKISYLF